jgi:hypothetical protein
MDYFDGFEDDDELLDYLLLVRLMIMVVENVKMVIQDKKVKLVYYYPINDFLMMKD